PGIPHHARVNPGRDPVFVRRSGTNRPLAASPGRFSWPESRFRLGWIVQTGSARVTRDRPAAIDDSAPLRPPCRPSWALPDFVAEGRPRRTEPAGRNGAA